MYVHFKLGNFDCYVLSDGGRTGNIEQEIADVSSEKLLQAMQELGYDTTAEISYNVLFVNTGEHKILFDTGTGQGNLLESLAEAGFQPEDVDRVVITHGDGDHIGGLLTDDGGPAFPNARYILWDDGWDQWTEPRSRAALIHQFLPLFRRMGRSSEELERMGEARAAYGITTLPALREEIDLVALGEEFLPGIQLFDASGHRSDQVGVAIQSDGKSLLHVADAVRHPVQVTHPTWNGNLDSFADQAAATRQRIVEEAQDEHSILFATHIAFPGLGTVEEVTGETITGSQRFVPLPTEGGTA